MTNGVQAIRNMKNIYHFDDPPRLGQAKPDLNSFELLYISAEDPDDDIINDVIISPPRAPGLMPHPVTYLSH